MVCQAPSKSKRIPIIAVVVVVVVYFQNFTCIFHLISIVIDIIIICVQFVYQVASSFSKSLHVPQNHASHTYWIFSQCGRNSGRSRRQWLWAGPGQDDKYAAGTCPGRHRRCPHYPDIMWASTHWWGIYCHRLVKCSIYFRIESWKIVKYIIRWVNLISHIKYPNGALEIRHRDSRPGKFRVGETFVTVNFQRWPYCPDLHLWKPSGRSGAPGRENLDVHALSRLNKVWDLLPGCTREVNQIQPINCTFVHRVIIQCFDVVLEEKGGIHADSSGLSYTIWEWKFQNSTSSTVTGQVFFRYFFQWSLSKVNTAICFSHTQTLLIASVRVT